MSKQEEANALLKRIQEEFDGQKVDVTVAYQPFPLTEKEKATWSQKRIEIFMKGIPSYAFSADELTIARLKSLVNAEGFMLHVVFPGQREIIFRQVNRVNVVVKKEGENDFRLRQFTVSCAPDMR